MSMSCRREQRDVQLGSIARIDTPRQPMRGSTESPMELTLILEKCESQEDLFHLEAFNL